jgi:hypothetical protein
VDSYESTDDEDKNVIISDRDNDSDASGASVSTGTYFPSLRQWWVLSEI